jgi:hypothetical protein
LVQPGPGDSLYKDFLENRGAGVYHLGFAVDHIDRSEAEVQAKGLDVISKGRRTNGGGFSYLDTAEKAGLKALPETT